MIRSFVFKIQMSRRHGHAFEAAMQHSNDLYNAALQERAEAWTKSKTAISRFDQQKSLTIIRSENPEFQRYAAVMQRTPLVQVDDAFKGFFGRVKRGQTPGFPRFRSMKRVHGFGFTENAGWKLKDGILSMRGLPSVRLKMHRQLMGRPLKLTIKRRGNKWFAIIVVDLGDFVGPQVPGAIGYDLGISDIVTDSDGNHYGELNPERLNSSTRLEAEQSLARKKRGSKRWRKTQKRLARQRRAEANRRRTSHFQLASMIVKTAPGTLVFENLAVKNMTHSAKGTADKPGKNVAAKAGLNRSLQDAGLSQFLKIVTDKAESAGRLVVLVDPRNTSQNCSACGIKVLKTLRQRRHICSCGCDLHRDHNAAINIRNKGVVVLDEASSPPDFV